MKKQLLVEDCMTKADLEISLDTPVILPDTNSKKLLGIEPTVITWEDMTSDYAWYKLAVRHDAYLNGGDFKDRDLFYKYWLLSLGLLEYPVILIGGEPGGGKSLFMAWLTRQLVKHFGKRATLDWTPPNPELFPNYFSLYDEDFQEKIIDEFNRLARIEKETGHDAPQNELEKLVLYNTVFGLDECDAFDKQTQNNLTQLLARIARRRRHTFTCLAMVLIDIERFASVILKQATHKVNCVKEGHYQDTCSILVQDVRRGGTGRAKWLWLRPEDHLDIWNSHNIPAITREVDIHFGNKPKPKVKKIQEDN